MGKQKKQAPPTERTGKQLRFLEIGDIRAVDETNGVYEASISSEAPVSRWWGVEILGHNPGEIRLERLLTAGSFLFAHGRDPQYGLVPVGPIRSAAVDEQTRKLRVQFEFDPDEKSQLLRAKLDSGSLKGMSLGYKVFKWLEVAPGATERGIPGPCEIAVDWEPFEFSLEPVAADPSVGPGRSEDSTDEPGDPARSLYIDQGQEAQDENIRSDENMNQEELARAQEAARTAERQRVSDISATVAQFRTLGVEIDPNEYINGERTADDVRQAGIALLAEKNQPMETSRMEVTAAEADKFRSAATDAMLMRSGVALAKPADGAKELRGARLLDLGMECYERQFGKRMKSYNKDEQVRAALSTSDFPLILSNTGNKAMMTAYELAPTTYQTWTKRGSLSDFKAAKRLQISELSLLASVKEGGEYKYQTLTEAGETIQLGKFGDIVSLTREMIINDDLQAFSNILAKFGAVARMNVESAVYGLLTANANMSDGVALFEATTHKNYTSSGTALSVASLGVGKKLMRTQKGLKGQLPLAISPAFLIVPEEKSIIAEQLITSTVDPAKNNATNNPFANKLSVVSCPILDANSATAWYLAAAPGYIDTVEVAFLDGNDAPYMETRTGFEVDGIDYKVRYEFGAAVLDYRGLYKNAGA